MTDSFALNQVSTTAVNALAAPVTPSKRIDYIDYSKVDPDILKAAEGMESMFIDYLMKVMRETVPKNEFDLESPATSVYRSMLDSELSDLAAKGKGIGLKDPLIAYLQNRRSAIADLQSKRYTEQRGQGSK
ncbi:MAG: rod-binding protein [Deltaproteobacteria bacterium]|nr:rod-binding protein [Deltaproteobacteria bacterium]